MDTPVRVLVPVPDGPEPGPGIRPLGPAVRGAGLLLEPGATVWTVECDGVLSDGAGAVTEVDAPTAGPVVVTPTDAEAAGAVTETEAAAPLGPAEAPAEVPAEPAGVEADAEMLPLVPPWLMDAPVEVLTEPAGVETDAETPALVPP